MLMFEVMFSVVMLERKLGTTETQTSTIGNVLVNQASLQRKTYAFTTFVVSITIADPPSIHLSIVYILSTKRSKSPKMMCNLFSKSCVYPRPSTQLDVPGTLWDGRCPKLPCSAVLTMLVCSFLYQGTLVLTHSGMW